MILCSLWVTALTACGGGGGSASAAAAAPAPVAVAGDTVVAGDATAAVVASGASSAATSAVPADAASSAVPTVAAADSIPPAADDAATAALSVKTTVVTIPIATEGQTFRVAGTMTVRYGAGSSWVTRDVTDSGTCTAAFFATAASTGTARTCQVQVSTTTGNATTVATVGLPGTEGTTFFTFGTVSVQFGANGKFVTKDVTGRADCTAAFFGNDPLFGVVKGCRLTPPPPTTLNTVSQLPLVDPSKIPAPAAGFSTARIMAANVADPGQNPLPSDIGDFREYCEYSHMSYDDPIVAPGGASAHLHAFMGNTGTNANSTATSIATTGNSTCAGGTLNRTAYWFPAMIDTVDGTPQKPMGSLVYYKQGYNYIKSTAIRQFPAGLRMVAGSSASSGIQDGVAAFTCFKKDGTWTTAQSIPADCPTGATLTVGVAFPQCWDGVNLDSPDHKSHMAYPGNGCPATHPVPVTGITVNINYKVGANGTSHWRLSSDNYGSNLPGGYSSHADWFNGWNTDILHTWTTRCINASMDCHAYLIGDGRILF